MPSGKDVVSGRSGGSGSNKKNAFCSFCRKSYRDVGPLVEGPGDVYNCGECIELCQSILEQENKRLKKLLAEAQLDKEILKEALEGNY